MLPRQKFHARQKFHGQTVPPATAWGRICLQIKGLRAITLMARQLLE
jgi:hypothetical protein